MAVGNKNVKDINDTAELRKEAGLWLRSKRDDAGLSQRDLAKKVGIDYYTFISQIEAGRGKVPSERYAQYAKALDVTPREFATTMLRYNDPHIYNMIFDEAIATQPTQDLSALELRLSQLEARLPK